MGAECFACGRDMKEARGCREDRDMTINGTNYDPIPYGEGHHFANTEHEAEGRCHDCGAEVGEYHHPGCDMETCPECNGQYFICECDTLEKRKLWGE